MAKEKNIPITESTSVAKTKTSPTQTAPSVIKHPIAEMERVFDRFLGGFPSLWHGRDFPVMDLCLVIVCLSLKDSACPILMW